MNLLLLFLLAAMVLAGFEQSPWAVTVLLSVGAVCITLVIRRKK